VFEPVAQLRRAPRTMLSDAPLKQASVAGVHAAQMVDTMYAAATVSSV
jgi:hypothetical protein